MAPPEVAVGRPADLVRRRPDVRRIERQAAAQKDLVATYRDSTRRASQEVEDGLVTFLRAQERTKLLEEGVLNALKAVNLVVAQYKVGTIDFTRMRQIEVELAPNGFSAISR